MSLEALFNQKIPEDLSLIYKEKSLSKTDIEWKDFKEKFRNLLHLITDVNIYQDYNEDYLNILRVNFLRNDLIHLKSIQQENFTFYQVLYKELINFDFEKHTKSVYNIITLLLK
jgi:hypothetical protein